MGPANHRCCFRPAIWSHKEAKTAVNISIEEQIARNRAIEALDALGYVSITTPLLAEVIRAAFRAGARSMLRGGGEASDDSAAQAYAVRQMQRGNLPTHDLDFLPVRDADQDTLLAPWRRAGATRPLPEERK